MSLESWMEEFYPISADETPEDEAIDHSIKKWEGLKTHNLEKHNCELLYSSPYGPYIIDSDDCNLRIDYTSCALCHYYLDPGYEIDLEDPELPDDIESSPVCTECPLAKSLGCPCDIDDMPYHIFELTGDPKPMIKALKQTKAQCS